jgi:hypothetical protein
VQYELLVNFHTIPRTGQRDGSEVKPPEMAQDAWSIRHG